MTDLAMDKRRKKKEKYNGTKNIKDENLVIVYAIPVSTYFQYKVCMNTIALYKCSRFTALEF